MDSCKEIILQQLTPLYRRLFQSVDFSQLEEIRFRIERPVMLYRHDGPSFLSENGEKTSIESIAKASSAAELNDLATTFCSGSIYAYLNDLKDGFITICGGHRVGIAGKSVIKNGEITNITDISGINLRSAREFPGCAREIASQLCIDSCLQNALLISPPQCGKTTFLRDLARLFSAKNKVVIVDERSEIAGSFGGVPQFDIGMQTDVLDRFPKAAGMLLAIRSLSPDILITDELGATDDEEALQYATNSGCRVIASIHGNSPEDVECAHPGLLNFFDIVILLGRKNNRPAVMGICKLR